MNRHLTDTNDGGPGSIAQQAAKEKAADAYTPANGNAEMNISVLEDQVTHYYGSASATFPVVGTVTVPSPAATTPGRCTRSPATPSPTWAGPSTSAGISPRTKTIHPDNQKILSGR
jgi:hypothetical protein